MASTFNFQLPQQTQTTVADNGAQAINSAESSTGNDAVAAAFQAAHPSGIVPTLQYLHSTTIYIEISYSFHKEYRGNGQFGLSSGLEDDCAACAQCRVQSKGTFIDAIDWHSHRHHFPPNIGILLW